MKRMLIDAMHPEETRVVIANNDKILDFDFVTSSKTQIKGNIYLAKITRVEPSLQAAFVEYGCGKQGFLPFSEIHPDYYQLPTADRQKLVEEQIAEAEAEEAAEEEFFAQSLKEPHNEPSDPPALANEEASALDLGIAPYVPLQPDPAFVEYQAHTSTNNDPTYGPVLPHSPVEHAQLDGEPMQVDEGFAPSEVTSEIDPNIEVTGGDDVQEDARSERKGRAFYRRYHIQEVIKRNQIILVQAIKEERGNKGASLTTYISLAGRYCVLMPNSPKGGGISRKITDGSTRRRLKEIAADFRTHRGMSVIIRTAGIDQSNDDIKRDYDYLTKLWNQIRENTLASSAPACVYEEGDIIKRSIRDLYTSDISQIVIEGETAHKEALSFMDMLMPSHVGHIKQHTDNLPILAHYGIEEQMHSMTDPQVKLPSGGYIVIQQTEALISIDVNSGRSTSERNVEETAIKTNMEAASEVARQLKLRDLAGLIVIDFIDMNYGKNRKLVERAMKDALKHDRAKIQLGRISSFGLMELSRQRLRPSISEAQGTLCPHCKGTGFIQSVETVGIQIVRTLEREAASGQFATLRVSTYPEAALHLMNEKRALLQSLEERFNVKVIVLVDTSIITGNYRLVKVTAEGKETLHDDGREREQTRGRNGRKRGKRGGRGRERDENDTSASDDDSTEEAEETSEGESNVSEMRDTENSDDRGNRRRGRRGGRNRRGGRDRDRPETIEHGEPKSESAEGAENEESVPRDGNPVQDGEPRRRSRGRRGGRNRRERGERTERPNDGEAASGEATNVIESRTWNPAPRADAPTAPAAPAQPIIIQTTTQAITHTPAPDTPDDSGKPKRRGWWSRVTEG